MNLVHFNRPGTFAFGAIAAENLFSFPFQHFWRQLLAEA
jgi:hypothetical protein